MSEARKTRDERTMPEREKMFSVMTGRDAAAHCRTIITCRMPVSQSRMARAEMIMLRRLRTSPRVASR